MNGLGSALDRVTDALDQTQPSWRGLVRQRMGSVSDALSSEGERASESWQQARARHLARERNRLERRVAAIREDAQVNGERFKQEVKRLISDIEHYQQRVHDLMYDGVALDLGGSE